MASTYIRLPVTDGGAPGSVDSFNGRTGIVVSVSGDYGASLITNTPAGTISATDVQAALNELDTEKVTAAQAAAAAPVQSVFSRTGSVVAANGDYTASQVTNVPAGDISSITVQAAIDELSTSLGIGSLPAGSIVFSNGTNLIADNTKAYWNNTDKTMVLGDSANVAGSDRLTVNGTDYLAQLTITEDAATDVGSFAVHRHTDTALLGAWQMLARSRGTSVAPTIVADNDIIFQIAGYTHDGVDYYPSALIGAFVDGTPASNDVPGALFFQTAPAAGALATRLTIGSDGTSYFDGFIYANSGIASYDGLGGTDSEAYGLGATTSALDRSLVVGPRASNSNATSANAIAIGIDSISGEECISIGNDSVSTNDTICMGHNSFCPSTSAVIIGNNASGNLIDVVIGGSAFSSGIGQNVVIGGLASCTSFSSVAIGYASTDGGFNNSFAMGASAACTANNQFVFGTNPTEFVLGRATGTTVVSAKTIRTSHRTGTNAANAGTIIIQPGLGTGTGARTNIIFNTPVVAASGTTPHTYAERLRLTETECVFNDGSVDCDFRIGCDTSTHCFFLDAGAGTVNVGASAAADSAKFYVDGKISGSGEFEINGDLNHDGTNIGFYGVAPVARPAAYTQTYSTATRTHSNFTSATLTDSTGGTANTTLVAIAGTGDDANINNNFADLIAQVNALIVDLGNAKQVLNQVIDDLQANGILQ